MKTKISAKIVADSLSPQGHRITTLELVMPRLILAELNTHRVFSKNSASSRAIPFKKMVEMVQNDPFIPIAWQKEHKGMQGSEYFTEQKDIDSLTAGHLLARDQAVERAISQNELGLTKQLCNRYLEPFMWHKVLLTATEFNNFFNLRCGLYSIHGCEEETGKILDFKTKKEVIKYYQSKGYSMNKCYIGYNPYTNEKRFEGTIDEMTDLDWLKINKGQAEIHMMELAECMYDALQESIPNVLTEGEYHIPFIEIEED